MVSLNAAGICHICQDGGHGYCRNTGCVCGCTCKPSSIEAKSETCWCKPGSDPSKDYCPDHTPVVKEGGGP